mmetsp:Transcript_1993/g.5163  ORF Transcript_1993/g.5163 Transcript_1993/m.5163 type:complete len:242 (-) Transcript_1993:24-749(-)
MPAAPRGAREATRPGLPPLHHAERAAVEDGQAQDAAQAAAAGLLGHAHALCACDQLPARGPRRRAADGQRHRAQLGAALSQHDAVPHRPTHCLRAAQPTRQRARQHRPLHGDGRAALPPGRQPRLRTAARERGILGDARSVGRQALRLLSDRGLWGQSAERRAACRACDRPLPVRAGAAFLRTHAAALEVALWQLHASAERLEQGHMLRLLALLLLAGHVACTPRSGHEPAGRLICVVSLN